MPVAAENSPRSGREFETLFSPEAAEIFIGKALGRHALHLEGDPVRFAGLISWSEINRLLSFGGLGYPRLRLIVGNDELPASEYSRTGRNGYPRLLVGELTGLLRSGAMLAIDALEQLHEPVSDLCGALERVLRTAVQADLYASWSDLGLRLPAWNDHDTLLLQIEGIRAWRLFQPTAYHPAVNSNPP